MAAGSLCLILALGTGAGPAGAAQDGAKDWPCKQALVPDLSYQLLWTGPSPKPHFDDWAADAERADLVDALTQLSMSRADAKARLRTYLERHAPISESAKAKIFAGIFQTIQENRRAAIGAIKRYSRGQQRAMDRIAELLRRLDELLAAEDPETAKVARTRRELDMTRRVFEERRQSIRALCEQPTLMEQRLGDLARVLQRAG